MGDPAKAYRVVFEQLVDLFRNSGVETIYIKSSAVSGGKATMALLEGAELRGVTLTAAATVGCAVHLVSKAATSKIFGERKVDQYLKDDDYWTGLGLDTGILKRACARRQ